MQKLKAQARPGGCGSTYQFQINSAEVLFQMFSKTFSGCVPLDVFLPSESRRNQCMREQSISISVYTATKKSDYK